MNNPAQIYICKLLCFMRVASREATTSLQVGARIGSIPVGEISIPIRQFF